MSKGPHVFVGSSDFLNRCVSRLAGLPIEAKLAETMELLGMIRLSILARSKFNVESRNSGNRTRRGVLAGLEHRSSDFSLNTPGSSPLRGG
jgi:hypothetical protein